jgi:hypothetical protein
MKIENIIGNNLGRSVDAFRPSSEIARGYGAERNEAHPEVAALLNAKLVNVVSNCDLLARDELELANFIINKLDIDPHYVPSAILMQAIRGINARLALGNNRRNVKPV